MRTLSNFLFGTAFCVVVVLLLAIVWLYFWPIQGYDRETASQYAPRVAGKVQSTGCLPALNVFSVDEMRPIFSTLQAAEGHHDKARHASFFARIWNCSVTRKSVLAYHFREMQLTDRLSRQFSSDEQMTMALNTAYFGDEQWGLANASQHYFGIPATQMDAAQRALLMSTIKRQSILRHTDRALARRNSVLDAMHQQGDLDSDTLQKAKNEP